MKKNSVISSGWKGDINGHIAGTEDCRIKVKIITLELDHETAWALCNVLRDSDLQKMRNILDKDQIEKLSWVGAAIGQFIDHKSSENLETKSPGITAK
jgi:hypothetical protein